MGCTYKTEKLFYVSFLLLKNKLNCCPIFFFFEVLEKIKPLIGLKFYKKKHKKKITKVTAIPFFLTLSAQYRKAVFWLSKSIQVRHEKKLILKIVNELHGINFLNLGESLKKKTEYYRLGIALKATKRFKW
jgi:ribosomal protein S7